MKKFLTVLFCGITLCSFSQASKQASPKYPGGITAFKEYLSENLEQPYDLEPGERITFEYMFILDADGSIENVIELPESGTYDKDVLDVINDIPNWDLHSSRPNEEVYFTVPVTFVGE